MKTLPKIAIVLTGLTLLGAWAKQTNDLRKAEWLIGTWENKTPRGSIFETWHKAKNDQFWGKSYVVKEKDTIIFEDLQLVQEEGGLVYVPTVKNQNGGSPVRFTSKTISATQLVFENPGHDFPQTISYTRITADSLVAEISGSKNGQQRKQAFSMKRVK